jgi:cytolethal distending toxin subunit A
MEGRPTMFGRSVRRYLTKCKLGAMIATTVAVVGGMAVTAPVASASTPSPTAPQSTVSAVAGFYLYNPNSDKCLSPAGGGVANNTPTVIYNCDTHASRFWDFVPKENNRFQIVNINSGRCLTPAGGGAGDNTGTVIYTCDEHPSRLWYVSNDRLVNHSSNKCLSPAGGGVANNTPTVIYQCDNHLSRLWARGYPS